MTIFLAFLLLGIVYCIAYLLVGGIFGGGYGMANTDSVLIGSLISLLLTSCITPFNWGVKRWFTVN